VLLAAFEWKTNPLKCANDFTGNSFFLKRDHEKNIFFAMERRTSQQLGISAALQAEQYRHAEA
jgi:hypothetical protein